MKRKPFGGIADQGAFTVYHWIRQAIKKKALIKAVIFFLVEENQRNMVFGTVVHFE